MKGINIIIAGVLLLFLANSCELFDGLDDYKDPKVEYTATFPLNGEWYVTLDYYDSTTTSWIVDAYGLGYNKILLYNLASNTSDSIWLDDNGLWPSKTKISCNPSTKVFTPCQSVDVDGLDVIIYGGSVVLNGTTTLGGNKSDSINIEITWGDDPGSYYRLAGYRRTGFLEDEH